MARKAVRNGRNQVPATPVAPPAPAKKSPAKKAPAKPRARTTRKKAAKAE